MHDSLGRAYARTDETRVDDILIADAGFVATLPDGTDGYCLHEGDEVAVRKDADGNGLFVPCACGKHFLAGQRDGVAPNTYYVGFYKK